MKSTTHDIQIRINEAYIQGSFTQIENANGLIIFAHGSGSSRFSSRNQFVAHLLNSANFSTLLFDLLTVEEEKVDMYSREFRFNIPLLAERLVLVTTWMQQNYDLTNIPLGYFGASTGAAAALIAAAQLQNQIKAVVSRGGRPDLAKDYLAQVKAATLLIVGELDHEVILLNKIAYNILKSEKNLVLVPGATHLFEEEGALDIVAGLSIDWLNKHMLI